LIFIKMAASADVLAVTAEFRRHGGRNFSAKERVEDIMGHCAASQAGRRRTPIFRIGRDNHALA